MDVDWAGRPLLSHAGSNGKNLAHILVDPAQDFGMVLVTNVASPDADQAFSELKEALYRKFATGK
jgi:hypothetical protein